MFLRVIYLVADQSKLLLPSGQIQLVSSIWLDLYSKFRQLPQNDKLKKLQAKSPHPRSSLIEWLSRWKKQLATKCSKSVFLSSVVLVSESHEFSLFRLNFSPKTSLNIPSFRKVLSLILKTPCLVFVNFLQAHRAFTLKGIILEIYQTTNA